MTKKELRQMVKCAIAGMTDDDRRLESSVVTRAIESLSEFTSARNIMLYSSLPDELLTDVMISRWKEMKNLFLPRVEDDEIVVLPYHGGALNVGSFGIMEPSVVEPISPEIIDLMIVPGRAFDMKGNRVGRGGGYYDRFLSHYSPDERPFTIGVGFRCQMFSDLSSVTEEHDFVLDRVIIGC